MKSTRKKSKHKSSAAADGIWYAKWLAFGFMFGFVLAPALLFGLGKQMPETRLGVWATGVEGKLQAWYRTDATTRLPAAEGAPQMMESGSRARAGYLNP